MASLQWYIQLSYTPVASYVITVIDLAFPWHHHHYRVILHRPVTDGLVRYANLHHQAGQDSQYLALHCSEDDQGPMHWVLCLQEMALMEGEKYACGIMPHCC